MRRCVLCGRWVLLAFQVEVGGFVCEAARLRVLRSHWKPVQLQLLVLDIVRR